MRSPQYPFQWAGYGAVLYLSSGLRERGQSQPVPSGFKGTFVNYLTPEHLLFSVLHKSALPSGLAPVANLKTLPQHQLQVTVDFIFRSVFMELFLMHLVYLS